MNNQAKVQRSREIAAAKLFDAIVTDLRPEQRLRNVQQAVGNIIDAAEERLKDEAEDIRQLILRYHPTLPGIAENGSAYQLVKILISELRRSRVKYEDVKKQLEAAHDALKDANGVGKGK